MVITNNKTKNIRMLSFIMLFSLLTTVFLVNNPLTVSAFANGLGKEAANDAIDAVFRVIEIICDIGGIFLIVGGIVKYAIAHANQQGPEEMKAFQWIVAGIVLALLGFLLLENIGLKGIIKKAIGVAEQTVGDGGAAN